MNAFDRRTILLGVCGGIAAYKSAELASQLVQSGAEVDVVMTDAAQQFIQPLTFSAITHRAVHVDPFAPWSPDFSGHVTLAERADLLIVAPATANTIARLALGLADDLLGMVALSTTAPILVAPAMEHHMFHHPATQEHLQTLSRRGVQMIGPEAGRLASGAIGDGRLAPPETILAAAQRLLATAGPLSGKQIVITAGGTREPLDPVRFIGNRSSGRMGYAIAAAALAAGANVTLITGPTAIVPPAGASIVAVETALEMQRAVLEATERADALIMAAAVSDFRSEHPSDRKIKKEGDMRYLGVRLVRNPDILASIDRPGLLKIGFAAETDDLLANARGKLATKGLAMIVANDAESTIGAPDSAATLLFADGRSVSLPRMAKDALANEIIRAVHDLLAAPGRDEW
jgi:phosphopantothenoylcysteine decarboxylase/phosphopantothenate--cysteine ligase